MIYLVASPGRTGSKLIVQLLSNVGLTPGGICNAITQRQTTNPQRLLKLKDRYNIVIHTHFHDFIETYKIDPNEVSLIISKRRDIFSAIMSLCVAHETKEWQYYSNKQIVPFILSEEKFFYTCNYFKTWYNNIDYSVDYNKIISIDYEDISNEYLANELNILQYTPNLQILPKSPYQYQDIILNWQDLLVKFNRP